MVLSFSFFPVSKRPHLPPHVRWSALVLLGLSGVCAVTFLLVTSPTFGPVTYQYDGKTLRNGSMPLSVPSDGKMLQVHATMELPTLHANVFTIIPDDCLKALTVNGVVVVSPALPFCDYTKGRQIDLRQYLRAGENDLQFFLEDFGGMSGVSVRPSSVDRLTIGFFLILLTLILPLGLLFSQTFKRHDTLFTLLLLLGIALRILYVFATPYNVRSHDVEGHIEYVAYVREHWRVPPADKGWQFYQPPAYYFLSAGTCDLAQKASIPCTYALQGLALTLSVATLFISAWMATFLFALKRQRPLRLLFFAAIVTFPSLVFFAARINNDVLLQFLTFAVLALLLSLWERPRRRVWYVTVLCLALAVLTKSNALLLVPVAGLTFLLAPLSLRQKLRQGAIAAVLFVAIVLSILSLRPGGIHSSLIGNVANLSSGLGLSNSWDTYVTFEPSEIIRHPFNNAWSDSERRQYFGEYLFRSAYFGEFPIESLTLLSRIVLLLGMLSLLPLLVGLYQTLRQRMLPLLPLWLCLAFSLVGHVLLRWKYPFSSSQDFRYVIFTAPVLAGLAIYGIALSRDRLVRVAFYSILTASILANALFLFLLYALSL